MSAADKAWIALGLYVLGYNVLAAPGQTLSEGADRYMLKHPWTTRAVALAVTAHVTNSVKPKYDPIHLVFAVLREWKS